MFKFVDYVHFARKNVDIKYVNYQIPKSILDGLFFKLKADIMLYMYECIGGWNGIFYSDHSEGQGVDITNYLNEFIQWKFLRD